MSIYNHLAAGMRKKKESGISSLISLFGPSDNGGLWVPIVGETLRVTQTLELATSEDTNANTCDDLSGNGIHARGASVNSIGPLIAKDANGVTYIDTSNAASFSLIDLTFDLSSFACVQAGAVLSLSSGSSHFGLQFRDYTTKRFYAPVCYGSNWIFRTTDSAEQYPAPFDTNKHVFTFTHDGAGKYRASIDQTTDELNTTPGSSVITNIDFNQSWGISMRYTVAKPTHWYGTFLIDRHLSDAELALVQSYFSGLIQ